MSTKVIRNSAFITFLLSVSPRDSLSTWQKSWWCGCHIPALRAHSYAPRCVRSRRSGLYLDQDQQRSTSLSIEIQGICRVFTNPPYHGSRRIGSARKMSTDSATGWTEQTRSKPLILCNIPQPLYPRLSISVSGQTGMRTFADLLSAFTERGDCILLQGPMGSGKTTFTRSFIQSLLNDPNLSVTSPTFLLDVTYRGQVFLEELGEVQSDSKADVQNSNIVCEALTVHHIDLWRLDKLENDRLIDFRSIYRDCVSLIEWPDRLSSEFMPTDFVLVAIDFEQELSLDEILETGELRDDCGRYLCLYTLNGSSWNSRILELCDAICQSHEALQHGGLRVCRRPE